MVTVRTVLSVIAVAFTGYLAARGLWWTGPVETPALMLAALGLYLTVSWLWIFWGLRESTRTGEAVTMPLWADLIALAAALLVPNLLEFAVAEPERFAPYVTWAIGGIGALMTIVMVRGRTWVAWTGTALMAVSYAVWLGPGNVFVYGLLGSLVWVGVAHLALIFLRRAGSDAQKLAELQQAASAWQAVHEGRVHERRTHVRRALAEAGPILSRTIATAGDLSETERFSAQLAESRLRDELRSSRLLDAGVRAAVDALRRQGNTVTLLDEGGLLEVPDDELGAMRAELAETLAGATSRRIYVRTSPDARVAITVVGRSPGEQGEEDAVDLWREIVHRHTSTA